MRFATSEVETHDAVRAAGNTLYRLINYLCVHSKMVFCQPEERLVTQGDHDNDYMYFI